jgi:hypothetical protein
MLWFWYGFFLTLHKLGQSRLKVPQETFIDEQLHQYFINYKYFFLREYTSCSYINVNSLSNRDISDWSIKHNQCPSVVAAPFFNASGYIPKTTGNFIFLESAGDEVKDVVDQVRNYSFWSSRMQNHFIICDQVKDTKFLLNLLRVIWERSILNFVVVFVFKRLEVFSYNPFLQDGVTNLSFPGSTLFSDKLRNLHGYQLRVSLFVDFPLTVKHEEHWVSRDYERLKLVTQMINASFKIIEPENNTGYFGAYDDIMANKSDFCFITHFYMLNIFQDAEYTYPHKMNALVVVVPTMNSTGRNSFAILSTFSPTTWILYLVLLVFFSATRKLSDIRESFVGLFINSFDTFLGGSISKFQSSSKSGVVKLKLITFMLGCIIFRTCFQCALISSFIKPPSTQQIETIEDLRNSKMTICTTVSLAKLIPTEFGLSKQIVTVTPKERQRSLYNLDTSQAYVIGVAFAHKYISTLPRSKDNAVFHLLGDILVPGVSTYYFQKHSPYLDKISELLQRERQYALDQSKQGEEVNLHGETTQDDNVVLTVKHLQAVFYLWIGGVFVALISFVSELICYHKVILNM